MCGIGGFVGDFAEELLWRMNKVMAHRGPDSEGVFFDPGVGVGLAHRRLSIIDITESGIQPMWDATRTCCITFNGEIYNFEVIRQDLLADGFEFKTRTDTEVLLNLYFKYGTNMFSRLNGIFAFAIYDARSRTVVLARDGFGVKPLYLCKTDKGILFASELKAILMEDSVPRRIDPKAVLYYVRYLWSPAPHTMLESVKKLEPGTALRLDLNGVVEKIKFFTIPATADKIRISESEAAYGLHRRIGDAVKRQLVSDVPVGAFLSGGIDSSTVCYFASQALAGGKLKCFTIDAGDTEQEGFDNDLPYARMVADTFDLDLSVIKAVPFQPDQLEKMIYHLDEPQPDPAALLVFMISQLASSNGIKVLLSGTGSDDILSGYRHHYATNLERFWTWLPQRLRSMIKQFASKGPIHVPRFRRLEKAFRFADRDGDERVAGYFHWISEDWERNICGTQLRDHLVNSPFSEPLTASLNDIASHCSPLTKILYLDARHFLIDHNLNYTDKMSMAAGIETRVPFLDTDVVRFAESLPDELKQKGKTGKYILKKAMENVLPAEIVNRSKTGFGVPVRKWLQGPLKEMIDDVLAEKNIDRRGLFNAKSLSDLRVKDASGSIDSSYSILAVLCIEMWLRIFVDKHLY